MAYSLADSLRREHRVGASLQPFQFNDTFSEDKFNHDIHWAINHLWTRSLESQRDLVDIKRYETNTRYFVRNVTRNWELNLPYFSYILEIPFNDVNFFDTREAKRRNVGKLNKTDCIADCDEYHVNSGCTSTHHVDRRKYPNLYTLQDTYTNRKMFNKHLLVFINGKLFTDMMFYVDIDRLILVIEPDVTSNDGTTIKLNMMKDWIASEFNISIIGIPWSPIYTFDGNPLDALATGTISLDRLTRATNSMNINTNEWLLCFTTDDVNMGDMTTVISEVKYHEETGENIFMLEDAITEMFTRNRVTHVEAFPIPNLSGLSLISTNKIFQIPVKENAIPTENIILFKQQSNGSIVLSSNTTLDIYYPNVYQIAPKITISSSYKFDNYEFDKDKFMESVNYIPGVYELKADRVLIFGNGTHANASIDAKIFGEACNYVNGSYMFEFKPDIMLSNVEGELEFSISNEKFNEAILNKTGLHEFVCINGISWQYAGNLVRLSDYGISITSGTPKHGDSISIYYENRWLINGNPIELGVCGITVEGICYINDTIMVGFNGINWYYDDYPTDITHWGIDPLNEDIIDGTTIRIEYISGEPTSTEFLVAWFQSFENATTFDNPISDYMAYNSSYANDVISGLLPSTLQEFIPLDIKYDYKDHIKHMKYTTTQSEFNYKAKRLVETLKEDNRMYEYIYEQLMNRTAYKDHANTKIVWDFKDIDSWTKYRPHHYDKNESSTGVFNSEMLKRLYIDNHDEFTKRHWAEFTETCYKFLISHDSPKTYAYSAWIDGKACPIKYIYSEGYKTAIYLPSELITETSIVEFEIMKIPNKQRFLAELDFGDLDNSVELPRNFPDVSPQNIMISIRREVSTNKSSSVYNPGLYEYLSNEAITAGEDFGVKYFYEVAPAYEMYWLLFGRRKYVDGISDVGTKITATTVPKLNFKDTLTNYKGTDIRTMFGEEFLTVDTDKVTNAVLVTADDEPTASGFYATERRRFYQYIPYGKDAEPIYLTPMGKPGGSKTQEVVFGYTRDDDGKIIKWHTQHKSLHSFYSKVTVVSKPDTLDDFAIVAESFSSMISYVDGEYTFTYSTNDEWSMNGMEHINLSLYGISYAGSPYDGDQIIIRYAAEPYFTNQHVLIQNADLYRRYMFTVKVPKDTDADQTCKVTIPHFFDEPAGQRFRVFCNGYLMEPHYDIDVDLSSFSGNFIRGDSIDIVFKNKFKSPYSMSPPSVIMQSEGLDVRILNEDKLFESIDPSKSGYTLTFKAHVDVEEDGTRKYEWSVEATASNPESRSFVESHTRLENWGIDVEIDPERGVFSDVDPQKFVIDIPMSDLYADVLVEYLPYKLNRVFVSTGIMDELVDCGTNNLTRPVSLKYYDIYLDGVKLYERDIRIITPTKFLIIGKRIRASTISIYERAHDTDLYGNEDRLPRGIIDSLCDNDNKFTEYLVSKYIK